MQRREAEGQEGRRSKTERAVGGTVERWRHGERIWAPTDRAGVWTERALTEHVLDDVCLAGGIDALQRDAGLRFKADFHAAGLEARLCGGYSSFGGLGGGWREPERTDAEEAAYRRWRDAVHAMGPLAECVLNVACFDQMPLAADAKKLRYGLEILKVLYGLGRASARAN